MLTQWLKEDWGRGDRTTHALFPDSAPLGKAVWFAKRSGVIAGLPIAQQVFTLVNPQAQFTALVPEGGACARHQPIATIETDMASLLMAERVALNITMRLSGISTVTAEYVQKIKHTKIQLLDTRKLTPGLRLLEKYATQVGGAVNHRYGLDEWAMIKDNHISACGGIGPAVNRLRQHLPCLTPIQVEVENLAQVQAVIPLAVAGILLDNMSIAEMAEAIALIRTHSPHTKIEASGGITLDNISDIAQLDLDYISTSAMITRSSWLDISMEIQPLAH
jgi:nicotinate-nucleotide pyrophosphorylase (carboxylating)